MHDRTTIRPIRRPDWRRAVLAVACAVAISGCGSFEQLMDRRQTATNQELSVEKSTLSIYLADVETLLAADAAARERSWKNLSLDHERAATTTNQLRLALAMATPGHAHTDLASADAMLTALLQKPQLLLSDEQMLARVHLGLLRSRISAESMARQASDSETRSSARELAAARAQLSVLQSDNQRLRKALTESEEKLKAMTLIERSIREREDESGGNRSSITNGASGE